MSSEKMNLNVHGRQVEIKPMTAITVKDMTELAMLDSKSEFYEITRASLMLKACLVNKDDWELFESMGVTEFGEIISDWSDLHNADVKLDG